MILEVSLLKKLITKLLAIIAHIAEKKNSGTLTFIKPKSDMFCNRYPIAHTQIYVLISF